MISLEKLEILKPLQKLPNILGDLGKLLQKALKSCPKSKKSTNLVTLMRSFICLPSRKTSNPALRQPMILDHLSTLRLLGNFKIKTLLKVNHCSFE